MRTLIALALMMISVNAMSAELPELIETTSAAALQVVFQEKLALALKGDAAAQVSVGFAYDYGNYGRAVNKKEAAKWYRLAAEQGYADAQGMLGMMYKNGQGVLQDLVYAHMWFNIGASNGSEIAAEYRDITAAKMTPAQLEKALDLARACVKKNYKGC